MVRVSKPLGDSRSGLRVMGQREDEPPSIEHLRSIGKSWAEIAESAAGVRAYLGSENRSKLPIHSSSLTEPNSLIEELWAKYRPGVNFGPEHDLKLAEDIDQSLLALGTKFVCEDWLWNWTTHVYELHGQFFLIEWVDYIGTVYLGPSDILNEIKEKFATITKR